MKLYHRTKAVAEILTGGFRDSIGGAKWMLFDSQLSGVWFSADLAFDENEGARGNSILVVEIPDTEVYEYEVIEPGKPYREFLIPAELANRYGPPCDVTDTYVDPEGPFPVSGEGNPHAVDLDDEE